MKRKAATEWNGKTVTPLRAPHEGNLTCHALVDRIVRKTSANIFVATTVGHVQLAELITTLLIKAAQGRSPTYLSLTLGTPRLGWAVPVQPTPLSNNSRMPLLY